MPEDAIPESGTSLLDRARKSLTLDSRRRFILLLALFNAMFCLLLLLSLQSIQLTREKQQLAQDGREMERALGTFEALATRAVQQIATLEGEMGEILHQTPTSTAALPSVVSTPVSPTSTPLPPTATRTPAPSPTSTPVPPSPTYTPVPPTYTPTSTPTPEPTHTPTPKPKPKPKSSPTRPPDHTSSQPPSDSLSPSYTVALPMELLWEGRRV